MGHLWYQSAKHLHQDKRMPSFVSVGLLGHCKPPAGDTPHPIPSPDDLMQRLSGGYYFTKIDLADAYNQVKLSPESQRWLTLSTHQGMLLQTRLPVWHIICSRIFPRNHGSSYLWPQRSSSIPGRHPSQWSKCKWAPAKSSSFVSTSSRKGTTMQAGEMWFCTTLGGVPRTHSLMARSIKRIQSRCHSQNATTYRYLRSTVISGHCPILWEIHP